MAETAAGAKDVALAAAAAAAWVEFEEEGS
jgi:hypothetical protein